MAKLQKEFGTSVNVRQALVRVVRGPGRGSGNAGWILEINSTHTAERGRK